MRRRGGRGLATVIGHAVLAGKARSEIRPYKRLPSAAGVGQPQAGMEHGLPGALQIHGGDAITEAVDGAAEADELKLGFQAPLFA